MADTTPRCFQVDALPVQVYSSAEALGQAATRQAHQLLMEAIGQRGQATLVLAAANSQLTFLHHLRLAVGLPWQRVRVLHLDEYLGLPEGHPAAFSTFLRRHLLDHIPVRAFQPLPGRPPDAREACAEYTRLLQEGIDLLVCGWGENGHLAFNDPPDCRFAEPEWVKVVQLAEASRVQQVGEGHFSSLAEVPTHALTLTIPAILSARTILCLVPEARKAPAVRDCLCLPVAEARPGSILRHAAHARLLLDEDSASLLRSGG